MLMPFPMMDPRQLMEDNRPVEEKAVYSIIGRIIAADNASQRDEDFLSRAGEVTLPKDLDVGIGPDFRNGFVSHYLYPLDFQRRARVCLDVVQSLQESDTWEALLNILCAANLAQGSEPKDVIRNLVGWSFLTPHQVSRGLDIVRDGGDFEVFFSYNPYLNAVEIGFTYDTDCARKLRRSLDKLS